MTHTSREAFVQQVNESAKATFNNVLESYNLFEGSNVYINTKRFFYAYYKQIPNIKGIGEINCPKMIDAICNQKKDKVLKIHYRQEYSRKENKMMYVDLIYFMKDGTVVNLEDDGVCIAFAPENEVKAQAWIDWAKSFTKRK